MVDPEFAVINLRKVLRWSHSRTQMTRTITLMAHFLHYNIHKICKMRWKFLKKSSSNRIWYDLMNDEQ